MNEIKRKHHYVWREYLRNWSISDKINAFMIKEKKNLKGINLTNVAQERYFYELEVFSKEEELVLYHLIKSWSDPETLSINLEIFRLFTSYSSIDQLVTNHYKTTSKYHSEVNLMLEQLKYNGIENIHTLMESFGKKIISINSLEDLDFLNDREELFLSVLYISFQYLRTKRSRKKIESVLEYNNISKKYANPISIVFSTGMANGLVFYKDLKIILLKNHTTKNFITSDQPLANLKEALRDESGKVLNFELYYPINPSTAMIIHYNNDQKEKYILEKIKDEKKVDKLNLFLIDNSENFVFSDKIELIQSYFN
ncbi:DUF4238 domain-containing protein [Chryseobacterium arthrosphaerae]|uniref:DUF4238 domain-containing protein n=1 Tax=Chryseobacterium arthrosphaerae TaxID=651561 RepID=UPI001F4B088B|nr:DUF4238 domain-containing protein [Chryseobacterium arthrosphaerae]